jgi:hydrogenase small subunit
MYCAGMVSNAAFIKFCVTTAAALGLEASMVPKVMAAMETKPRIPVIWLHGLECTCCSESFIRSSHPIAQAVVLNMISLDYDDTLQAAAGGFRRAVERSS